MTIDDIFSKADPYKLSENPFQLIGKDWFLVTAGKGDTFNTMTAGWGSFGVLWNKPVITTFIRPTRHTFSFAEESDYFSACFFSKSYRKMLNYCGSVSGKDVDKVKESGLTTLFTPNSQAIFAEAYLAFECRKLYYSDILPENFMQESIFKHYPLQDFHRMYVGEILTCWKKK
ncbi:flavin reductase family protein [Bacteroidota bacterium]